MEKKFQISQIKNRHQMDFFLCFSFLKQKKLFKKKK